MTNITPADIRSEAPDDITAIRSLVKADFLDAEHADGTEHGIVDRLRERGTLTASLVAVDGAGEIIGHVAASPVSVTASGAGRVSGAEQVPDGWYGIGPLSVTAGARRQGVGALLMAAVLEELRGSGARAAVLLGDPAYYGRFGFVFSPRVAMAGLPDDAATYFQVLPLDDGPLPGSGSPILTVGFDEAFAG